MYDALVVISGNPNNSALSLLPTVLFCFSVENLSITNVIQYFELIFRNRTKICRTHSHAMMSEKSKSRDEIGDNVFCIVRFVWNLNIFANTHITSINACLPIHNLSYVLKEEC